MTRTHLRRLLRAAPLLLALGGFACSDPNPGPSAAAGPPSARATPEALERLRALPYAATALTAPEHRGKIGVTRHDPGATPGLNLYASPRYGEARLFDMDGRVLHLWANAEGQPEPGELLPSLSAGWAPVRATPDGSLFALVNRHSVLRLDGASRILWSAAVVAHHELAPEADGGLLTLSEVPRRVETLDGPRLVADNEIVKLDARGRVGTSVSLLDVLRTDAKTAARLEQALSARYAALDRVGLRTLIAQAMPEDGRKTVLPPHVIEEVAGWFEQARLPQDDSRTTLARLRAVPGAPADLLHANTLERVRRRVPGFAEPGDVLVAVRNLDLVAVVDLERGRLRWTAGPGLLDGPHQPTFGDNDRLLVFDNGPTRGYSRILELDAGGRVTWSYGEKPGQRFFTGVRGGCQALPGGNVLVTESEAGRAFEVTRDGEIVWEFFNPAVDGPKRETLYRLERVTGAAAERLALAVREPK